MPIRTNRGRSAVYRRIWAWPLRSPKHMIAFLVGLVVIAFAIAQLMPSRTKTAEPMGNAEQQTQTVASPSFSDSGAAVPLATRLTSPLLAPTSAPVTPEALDVALRWSQAWVNHPAGMTSEQWLAQLKPYTTDEYLPVMGTINVAGIPATKIIGPPKALDSTTSSAVIAVPTDTLTLELTVALTDHQGWRVSHYTREG